MPEYINRPPRIQPELPGGEVEIPSPPQRQASGIMGLLQSLLPVLAIVGFLAVGTNTGGGGGGAILFIIPIVLSTGATSILGVIEFFRSERADRAKMEGYKQKLIDLRNQMIEAHDKQRAFYAHNYPDMDAVVRMVNLPNGDVDSRLWERRTTDNDFGSIRLGIGTLNSTFILKPPSDNGDGGPLYMEGVKLADDSRHVRDVPISIPLRPISGGEGSSGGSADPFELGQKIPQIGRFAIGVAGGDRKAAMNFIRSMFVNYTAFHSPNDTRLYVIGSADAKPDWDWARWLPHCNTGRNENGKGDQLAFEPKKARRLWEIIQNDLERRQLRMSDSDENSGNKGMDLTVPFLVVVVDAMTPGVKDSPIEAVSTEAAISLLLNAGPILGACVVFLVPKRDLVPSECRAIVEFETVEGYPSFRYAEIGLNTLRHDGAADVIDEKRADLDFARKIAPKVIRSTFGSDIANAVNLLELFSIMEEKNYEKPEEFPLLNWWRATRKPEKSEWMLVPIGLMGGNKVRSLLFAADGDGVHGLVAGTTGSGKSELLLTIVVGLAMRYDPSVINFVLADYKGGTAFDPFKTLPHAVDIVTSLQGLAGVRTFIATKAEMNRRSAMIANTNTKHIVHYRQKNLHVTREPFAFLFIIVDEFAEMVKENPETKGYLDSITRLGRALGVTLMLATQRPGGVITDQMRSNMKWKICLRVETPEDSREMFKRSDAAFLPNNIPGRGYLQVGNDNIELMQVARAGAPYTGDQDTTEPPVIWLSRSRATGAIDVSAAARGPAAEAPAISDLLVGIMARLAAENEDVVPQKKPWPDPLPEALTLDQERLLKDVEQNPLLPLSEAVIDWLEGEGGWHGIDWQERAMRVNVGLIDNPIRAEQLPLNIDFTKGHLMVFGASGWGKTIMMRSIITALTATHSPTELHIYIMDFGGKGLDVLSTLPHVASVVQPGQDDRVQAMLRRLADEIEQRKLTLSQSRADSIADYNTSNPKKPIPAVLCVIDNFAEFRENYEDRLPELMNSVRDGRSTGVHFAITAQQSNAIPNKLFNMITERMTFRLADPQGYQEVVGKTMPHLPEIGGRGFCVIENEPLEMQVALPVGITDEDSVEGLDFTKKLAKLVDIMNKTWGDGPRPQSVDLVRALSLMELFSQMYKTEFPTVLDFPILEWWRETRKPEKAEWMKAPLGLVMGNKVRSMTFAADADGSHGMVAGTTGSGKSELLLTLVAGVAMRYDPSVVNFVLADYKGGAAFDPFRGLPHAVDIVSNLQGTAGARTFTAMKAEMNRRSGILAQTQTKHLVHYRQKNLHTMRDDNFAFLFVIVDEFAEMVKENPEFKGNLDSITRLGRALGMMLILATQRPAGVVTDQMRSNMKWKICLRVETAEDSRELLKKDDAAYLPNSIPGRGYLQVGNDPIELMQVARAGGPYTGKLPDYLADMAEDPSGDAPALSNVLTMMMKHLMETNPDVAVPKKPYPDPLPARMTTHQLRLENDIEDNPLLPLSPAIIDWMEGRGDWKGINWARQGMRANIGFVDDPGNARNIQMQINFNKGHLAVFGASGWGKTVMMRTIVTALAATHSPQELHVYIADYGGKGLDVLDALPHVATTILTGQDDRIEGLIRRLNDELDQRKDLLSQARSDSLLQFNAQHPDRAVACILVVIDNFTEVKENYENLLPDITAIVRDGRAYGIYFAITAQVTSAIPIKLFNMFSERMTFRLTDVQEYAAVVNRNMPNLPEIAGRGFLVHENEPLEYQVALPVGATPAEIEAGLDDNKKLAELIDVMKKHWGDRPVPQSVDLVKALSLMELFEFQDRRDYKTVLDFPILDWWEFSRKPKNAEWMRAPVGLITGNKVRTLVFAADADGSHGMVAGTTGSGKSELLLTVVAGMALRYDPSVVNFILADYKGGAAFDPFRGLPHAVDIVSNLQGLAGARTFNAMKAEMNRRSAILAITQAKHVVHYRQRNLHETREPFPFLFVIVDEFAEMVKENPEFKGSLDSITRLGRALGVCLILATQRPAGVVTDQMRSNMKWRICLRVETAEDSKELLKGADAAFLPNNIPGRAYLQVGNGPMELMQVARAGGPYTGPMPDYMQQEKTDEEEVSEGTLVEAPALSNVLTLMMKHLQEQHSDVVKAQTKPYPDPLPERVTLDQERLETDIYENPLMPLAPAVGEWLAGKGSWKGIDWTEDAMRATVGLVDNPFNAEQLPLKFDLQRGHAVIFGASGFGKTVALRTIVMALAATHSPKELNVYAFDFGGRGLDLLLDLPHVGDTVLSNQKERIERLLRKLSFELEERKGKLALAKAESLFTYNKANPEKAMPAILVLIDNFAEFKENYEDMLQQLMSIVRDGRSNGIHFVITADQSNSIYTKLLNMITERYAFKLTDIQDYGNFLQGRVPGMPQEPGRGFVEIDRQPLEMQIAMPVGATKEEREAGLDDPKKLAKLVQTMNEAWGDQPRPEKIEILQRVIPLSDVMPEQTPPRVEAYLGIEDERLLPATFDLQQRGPHIAIVGPPLSGKTNALRVWAISMARLYTPKQVMLILVDMRRRFFRYGGQHTLDELPHVVATVTDLNEVKAVIRNIRLEYETPNRNLKTHPRPEIYMLIDNYEDFSSTISNTPSYGVDEFKALSDFANKYGPDGFHIVAGGSTAILRSQDDILRKVMETRYAIGLDAGESASNLGGRIRYTGGDVEEFPPGRGYIVRSSRVSLMQVAMPLSGTESMEEGLDAWVEQVLALRHEKAKWFSASMTKEQLEAVAKAQKEQEAAVATEAYAFPPVEDTGAGVAAAPAITPSGPEPAVDLNEIERMQAELAALDADNLWGQVEELPPAGVVTTHIPDEKDGDGKNGQAQAKKSKKEPERGGDK